MSYGAEYGNVTPKQLIQVTPYQLAVPTINDSGVYYSILSIGTDTIQAPGLDTSLLVIQAAAATNNGGVYFANGSGSAIAQFGLAGTDNIELNLVGIGTAFSFDTLTGLASFPMGVQAIYRSSLGSLGITDSIPSTFTSIDVEDGIITGWS